MSPARRARPIRGPLAALLNTGVGKAWIGPALLGTALLLTACGREAVKPRVVGSPHQTPVPSAAQLQAERTAAQQRQAAEAKAAAVALRRGWSEGHQSTVACLHGERITQRPVAVRGQQPTRPRCGSPSTAIKKPRLSPGLGRPSRRGQGDWDQPNLPEVEAIRKAAYVRM
jgi:hypothetical protein